MLEVFTEKKSLRRENSWIRKSGADIRTPRIHLQLDDTEPIIIPSKRLISPILLVNHESRCEAQKFYDMRMPIYQHIVEPLPMDQQQYRYWYSGSDKTKEEIRASSTGDKIGTLYLSTECKSISKFYHSSPGDLARLMHILHR
jgi:hypothetical protein